MKARTWSLVVAGALALVAGTWSLVARAGQCQEILLKQNAPTIINRNTGATGWYAFNYDLQVPVYCQDCSPALDGGIYPDGGQCNQIGQGIPLSAATSTSWGSTGLINWPGTTPVSCITAQDGGMVHGAALNFCDGDRAGW